MKTEGQTTGIIPDATLRPARTAEADAAERTPNPKWASWALVEEARKEAHGPASELCINRLDIISGHNPPMMFVVTTYCGHWGRGKTPAEAAKTAIKAGARKTSGANLLLVVNDETPEVNSSGMLITEGESIMFRIGQIRTLGALIPAGE
jgi:hypothetical protein